MAVTNATQKSKTVADPLSVYESMRPLWEKSRAVIGGERFVKDYDSVLDTLLFANLLLPFSPSMSQEQYNFYRSEAEFPGVVSQYARILIGGLLRKQPQLALPKEAPADAYDWIMQTFTHSNSPLISFLDEILWEELQTSRAWIYVDHPVIPESASLSKAEREAFKPYPCIWNAESIINWRIETDKANGLQTLSQIIVRNYEQIYKENEFHPSFMDTVWVHELVDGAYRIRKFQKAAEDAQILVVNGKIQQKYQQGVGSTNLKLSEFVLVETIENIVANGERLTFIPAWPLNGNMNIIEPILTPFIDKEISLYNKLSRRNHLLYGAATYTPVIAADITDEQFEEIVEGGLGTWIRLRQGDTASVLETPTQALTDMDRAIAATLEDLAKLGIRMLTPETSQSGVALELRNAAQTSQMGTLNTKISNTMASIIAFMLNWRYDLQLKNSDIQFELSADFNPAPLGADWLRLVTEWYQGGLIPRSVWLQCMKQNDILNPDYNDEDGQIEITNDQIILGQNVSAYDQAVANMAGIENVTPIKAKK